MCLSKLFLYIFVENLFTNNQFNLITFEILNIGQTWRLLSKNIKIEMLKTSFNVCSQQNYHSCLIFCFAIIFMIPLTSVSLYSRGWISTSKKFFPRNWNNFFYFFSSLILTNLKRLKMCIKNNKILVRLLHFLAAKTERLSEKVV